MAFDRPTRSALVQRAVADYEAELQNGAALIRRSFERASAVALAGQADSLHAHLAFAARQLIIDSAEDEVLVRWADTFMGPNARRPAQKAEFPTQFTGTASSPIPQGTNVVRADGATFTTLAAATIPAVPPLEVDVIVQALVEGDEGNTIPGTVLTLENSVAGIDTDTTVQGTGSDPIGGGADLESIPALKARLLDLLQDPPEGGGSGDYVKWALESGSNVTRAWELPLQLGPSSVLVLFVQDTFDSDGFFTGTIFPDGTAVQAVYDYIADVCPISVALQGLYVQAPTALELDPVIAVSPNNSIVQEQIRRSLEDLLLRESKPNGALRLSQIREAISLAADEDYHDLVSPAADVVTTATQIHTLGTITFQDA